MYIVFLRFGENRNLAAQHRLAHRDWLEQGFDDGLFVASGTLEPRQGGFILTHTMPRSELDSRLAEDPFVRHDIVQLEVRQLSPAKLDPRLEFLFG